MVNSADADGEARLDGPTLKRRGAVFFATAKVAFGPNTVQVGMFTL